MTFHHKDPFDRLIAATAIDNDMTVITLDEHVAKYPVNIIW
ncbi:PIN domain-containing protein [Parapedobacter tibetensis]